MLNSEFRPKELHSLKMIQIADKNLCMSIAKQNICTSNKLNKAQFVTNYSLGGENSCTSSHYRLALPGKTQCFHWEVAHTTNTNKICTIRSSNLLSWILGADFTYVVEKTLQCCTSLVSDVGEVDNVGNTSSTPRVSSIAFRLVLYVP